MKLELKDCYIDVLSELLRRILTNDNGDFELIHVRIASRLLDQIEDLKDDSRPHTAEEVNSSRAAVKKW